MVMSSDSARLVGENVFKRKKRKTTSMPDSPAKKKIPTGAKKATPTVAIPDAPKKAIPTGATPVKQMTGKIDPKPSKPIPTGAKPTGTYAMPDAPRKKQPRPQNPDLLKGGMNGASTLTSALTVGKQLNGMAIAMKQKKPF